MTLQEFISQNGLSSKYDEEGRFTGFNGAPTGGAAADQYYKGLAQLMGYKGSDPGQFYLGMQDVNGSAIPKGSYMGHSVVNPGQTWDRDLYNLIAGSGGSFGALAGGNAESDAAKWAMSQGGVNPADYFSGQRPDGPDYIGMGLQAAGMAAMGGLATGAWGGGGSVFDSATTAAAETPWGVNKAATGAAGEFSLAEGSVPQAASGLGLNTANTGLGLSAAGAGTAGAGLTGAATAGAGALLTPAITGGATGIPAAAGGGGFLDSIGEFAKSIFAPTSGKNDPFSVGNVGGALLSYLNSQNQADALRNAGSNAMFAGNPLNDPQRQQYQQQLQQLLQNPESFYSSNPVVKAQMELAKQQFEANSAKMGTGGTQFNDYLKNVQTNAASTYNTQADLLAQLSGFKFPGGAGVASGTQANIAGANADAGALSGFANIFGQASKNSTLGQTNIFDAAKNIFSLG